MCKECSICSSPIETEEYREGNIRSIMTQKNMCWQCAFWQEKLDLADEDTIIANGTRYQGHLVDKTKAKGFLGFGGRDIYFQMLDNSQDVRHYNDCWCQGDVPELWKDKLKDNAKFITKKEYLLIKAKYER